MKRPMLWAQTNLGNALATTAGLTATIAAILALVGIAPRVLASIAAICVGAGLLSHGALVVRRLFELPRPTAATEEEGQAGEGAGDEILGGACAIAFGILALVGFAPLLLLGIAAIAAGGALVFAGPSRPKFLHLAPTRVTAERREALRINARYHERRRSKRRASESKRARNERAKHRVATRSRAHAKSKNQDETASHVVEAAPAETRENSKGKRAKAKHRRRANTVSAATASAPAPAPTSAHEDDVAPLFEHELLEGARANAAFVDVSATEAAPQETELLRDVAANAVVVEPPRLATHRRPSVEVQAVVEAPRVVEAQPSAEPPLPRETPSHLEARPSVQNEPLQEKTRAPRRGLFSALRIAREALHKAKELKHSIDARIEAHPIARLNESTSLVPVVHSQEMSLVPTEGPVETQALVATTHAPETTALVAESDAAMSSAHEAAEEIATELHDAIEHKAARESDVRTEEHEREMLRELSIRAAAARPRHDDAAPAVKTTEAKHEVHAPARTELTDLAHEREALAEVQELTHTLEAQLGHDADQHQLEDDAEARREVAHAAHQLENDAEARREVAHAAHQLEDDAEARREVAHAAQHESEWLHGALEKAHEQEHELTTHLESHNQYAREEPSNESDTHRVVLLDSAGRPIEHSVARAVPEVAPEAAPDGASRRESERARDRAVDIEKRKTIPAGEPIPVTSAKIHAHPGIYVGGAVNVVGGLAAVVLGILALVGVARAFVLAEVAMLVCALALVVGAVGSGIDERHED